MDLLLFWGETGDSANRSNRAYASFLLRRDAGFVCKQHAMAVGGAIDAGDLNCSYGPHVLDHLAADGAGFARGQVAVVALLQVDADLPWCPK